MVTKMIDLDLYFTSVLTFVDMREKLAALSGWSWQGGDSELLGAHLDGTHTSGVSCSIHDDTGTEANFTGYWLEVVAPDETSCLQLSAHIISLVQGQRSGSTLITD